MEICINLEFGDGNFESGFDEQKFHVTFITLQQQIARFSAQLNPNTNIPIFTDTDSSNQDKNQPPAINSVSFSPEGKTLAFATDEQVVKIWDFNSNTPNKSLPTTPRRHSGKVNSVNFSPDGKILVSASDTDGNSEYKENLKLWSAATVTEITTLERHSVSVNSASFSSDGKKIVSASNDGTYIIWNYNLEELIEKACTQLPRDLHNLQYIDRSNISNEDKEVCKK
ncbi:hypothetical protein RIVM261_041590 [Rivularia sp. IAM M-261]|nr:hypothetical protein RIVM261_041590 [Rivularia sp. IAM M-261]